VDESSQPRPGTTPDQPARPTMPGDDASGDMDLQVECAANRRGRNLGWVRGSPVLGRYGTFYDVETDPTPGPNEPMLRVHCLGGPRPGTSCSVARSLSAAPYAACGVVLGGMVRTDQVDDGGARLFIAVTGRRGTRLYTDLMGDRPILGTNPWHQVQVCAPVADDAVSITVGCALLGRGTLWVRDLRLGKTDARTMGPSPLLSADGPPGPSGRIGSPLPPPLVRASVIASGVGLATLFITAVTAFAAGLPIHGFLAGMAGITAAGALNIVVGPVAGQLLRWRHAGVVLAAIDEEVPRVLVVWGMGRGRFGPAIAIGLGWAGLHAAGLTALTAAAVLAAVRGEAGPTRSDTPQARAVNLYLFAAWQATTQLTAQVGFTLLVARSPWLVLGTLTVHAAWTDLTRPVWRLPVPLRIPTWLASGLPVLGLALLLWSF
jgi:hypothetical protein